METSNLTDLKADESPKNSHWHLLIVNLLFILSGLSSLVYQVIWTRMLVFVFGSTTLASSTVLAVFMTGLALGSFMAGRYADKARKPFLFYGCLEGLIGIWALLAPFLFSAAIPIYKMFFEQLHMQPLLFGLLRFLVAAVILLPPTAAMGATLPLLARFITKNLSEVGNRVGNLYAMNTLGAVIGSIAAGFFLIPAFGISATTLMAAATNIVLALLVLWLSKTKSFQENRVEGAPGATQPAEQAQPVSGKLSPAVLAVMYSFAASGAIAMLYEVAWTRSLLMVIGSTTYAFTIMLSTFLLGIFIGSLICSRLVDRLAAPLIWFALAEIILCLAGITSVYLFNYLPYVNMLVGAHYGKLPEISMLFRFLAAACVMMPISLCLGFIFPLVVKICASDLERLGKSIGQRYSINTLGAIAGAFLAGFVIIPALGSEQALLSASVANLVLGLALLLGFGPIKNSLKVVCTLATALIIFFLCQSPPSFWDYRLIVRAQTERRLVSADRKPLSLTEWRDRITNDLTFPFYKEGKVANVAIVSTSDDKSHTMYTNGHADASDTFDMENQAMVAAYPLLLKPEAKDVCVVGWGSGVTAGYALKFPIKELICSEIEPVVIEASKYFHSSNYKPEEDKRTIVEPSDGRNYLLGTQRKFDVVISEPSNPWQAGVCNLFTAEYFKICKDSLKPGGIFTMWSQINEIKETNLAQVFSALHQAFPYVYVFDTRTDINAIASCTPIKISYEQLKKALANPEVVSALSKFHLQTPEDFIGRIMVCPSGADAIAKSSTANSDDRNYLEYEVAKTYENHVYRDANLKWLNENSNGIWDFVDWGNLSKEETAREMVKVATAALKYSPVRAAAWANESLRTCANPEAFAFIAQLQIAEKNYATASKTLADASKQFPEDDRFVGLAGVIKSRQGDYLSARKLFEQAISMNKSDYNFRYFLARTYSNALVDEGASVPESATDSRKVIELCKDAATDQKFVRSKPDLLFILADAYKNSGDLSSAEQTSRQLLKLAPQGYLNWQQLGDIYMMQNKVQLSEYCQDKALLLAVPQVLKMIERIATYSDSNKDDLALDNIRQLLRISPANGVAISYLQKLARHDAKAREYLNSINTDASFLN